MKTLYLSYDGMTDNLGQSQVIPYLAGLSAEGYQITLISFEKVEKYDENKDRIGTLLNKHHITWKPLMYTKQPPILSTIWDVYRLQKLTEKLLAEGDFKLVHCRSYITSLVGEKLKKKYGLPFIFDMRAFYADERVDGKLWDTDKWVFKKVYEYFKKKELDFLKTADYTITLTQKAKNIIHGWQHIPKQPIPIQVIPCCADLEHFSKSNINMPLQKGLKAELGITEDDFVLSYLGSIGTWYLLDEMLAFFENLLMEKPQAKFLFITSDEPGHIYSKAQVLGIPKHKILIRHGKRDEVPTLISLSALSIFFIQPFFSKQGSSPTKHGEILGMGVPVICNAGVGDVDEIVNSTKSGILVKEMNPEAYQNAISQIDSLLAQDPLFFRQAALKFYSLEAGVKKYLEVYQSIIP